MRRGWNLRPAAGRRGAGMSAPLASADAAVLERLAAALGPGGVVAPEPRYLEEPRGRFHGQAAAVLRPASTAAVAAAVAVCAAARVGIVPYSGGTGLVGGQILGEGPLAVIMSFERMAAIRDLDLVDGVLVAEAGCVLADVQAAARKVGRLFPLTLASEGSARIGGLLGTNAGGVNVLHYGNARDLCLGVEAVMADGTVVNGLSRVVKDNMGYDLRHLLIGAEGTLGLITAASLRLMPEPGETATAWVSVASPEAALDLLHLLRVGLGGAISAFELIGVQGLAFLAEVLPDVPVPPAMPGEWRVLVEAAELAGVEIGARLEATLGAALERGLVGDGADRAERGAAAELLAGARDDPGGEPADRGDLQPRHLDPAGAVGRVHRTRGSGDRRPRSGAQDQLLRSPRRRQSALQRVPAEGSQPGRATTRCARR